jgi:hypothetical protein
MHSTDIFPPHVSKHSLFTVIKALQNGLADSGRFLTAAEQTVKYILDNYTLWKRHGNVTIVAPTIEFQSHPHKARQKLRFKNTGNVLYK